MDSIPAVSYTHLDVYKRQSQPSRYTQPVARIVEVLGSIDDPGIEIEIAVRKFGLPHIFSREALLEADKLPDQVAPDRCV